MDIAALSIGMSRAKVSQEVKMSVLKMVMDSAKGEASDISKLMESSRAMERSLYPHLGSSVDIRV